MSIKYKIDDAKKNKNLINDEIKLSRIKSKGGPGGDGGRKPPKQRKAPAWFVEFEKRNNQRLDKIENNVSSLRSDVNILKTNLNRVIKLNNLKH